MLSDSPSSFGNLQSYLKYTRPTAKRLFGDFSFRKKNVSKHQENVQKMLEVLALKGTMTTWDMAKELQGMDLQSIRSKEKEFRRILIGRRDRGKKTSGVLDVGLVLKAGQRQKKAIANLYRLSLHGILYCLDVLEFSNKEIDKMASNYKKILPHVFGKWDYLKSILGNDIYRLKLLAGGFSMDNIQLASVSSLPIYEITSFINTKYSDYYESINEKDLADQISYWFFTILLIPTRLGSKQDSFETVTKWKNIFKNDQKLKKWYFNFVNEVTKHYRDKFSLIKDLEPT
jgi:hypothetical protein